MKTTIRKRFLTNRDETGRFIVISKSTGVTYYVEPILGKNKSGSWGDFDPTTKKFQGSYGNKNIGAIKEEDSIINNQNGFKNIQLIEGSPLAEIFKRDKLYEQNKSTQNDYADVFNL